MKLIQAKMLKCQLTIISLLSSCLYFTTSYVITPKKQANTNILLFVRRKNINDERLIINGVSSSEQQNTTTTTNPIMLSVPNTLKNSNTDENWMLLPWLPSSVQIQSLNLTNLRKACQERGLPTKLRNIELQNNLIEWTQEQHQLKVNSRRSPNKKSEKLEPDYYSALQGRRRIQFNDNTNSTNDNTIMDYRVVPFDDSTKSNSQNSNLDLLSKNQFYESLPPISSQSNSTSSTSSKEYLKKLTQTFRSSPYSETQLEEMYNSAKAADKRGDITTSKSLLLQLLSLTPHDGRILRRLSRLEQTKGNLYQARSYLLQGVKQQQIPKHNNDPNINSQVYFYHALGVMEVQQSSFKQARMYFTKALKAQPTFPNTYHAWSRMEYSQGNIKLAVRLLKKGLFYSKTNHRLYHELGNLYREAGLYTKSEECLRKGLEAVKLNNPNQSFPLSFLYTSLSYVYYEIYGYDEAKIWLEKALIINKLHAQGWLALAQLEESEGNIQLARETYIKATSFYESFIDKKKQQQKQKNIQVSTSGGDRWSTVYLSWGRMEKLNSNENEVPRIELYQRALKYFPNRWDIWIELINVISSKKSNFKVTEQLFELACSKVGNSNAEPFQLYAEYETSLSNYERARSIYLQGAKTISNNNKNNIISNNKIFDRSLSKLLHSWAKLEIRLTNFHIANQLLDKSLQVLPLISSDEENDVRYGRIITKSQIFTTMAKLEFKREHYYMAQHCVCQAFLQLQAFDEDDENDEDDYYSTINELSIQLWSLWSDIANRIQNEKLEKECQEQVCIKEGRRYDHDRNGNLMDGSSSRTAKKSVIISSNTKKVVLNRRMKKMLGKAPWYRKLFL